MAACVFCRFLEIKFDLRGTIFSTKFDICAKNELKTTNVFKKREITWTGLRIEEKSALKIIIKNRH